MYRNLLSALLMLSSAQQLASAALDLPRLNPKTTLDTILAIPRKSDANVLRLLLGIGLENGVPLGVAVENKSPLCTGSIHIVEANISVRSLIDAINDQLHGYEASFNNGVINVLPRLPPANMSALLDLNLTEFHSDADAMSLQGVTLWMFIRGATSPDEATGFAGSSAVAAQIEPRIDLTNTSVRTILNVIVDRGGGGVWLWKTPLMDEALEKLAKPYEVYGYVGDENKISNLTVCTPPV